MNRHAWIFILLLYSSCRNPGTPLWNWSLESRSYAQPVLDGDVVYIVSQAGEIIAGNSRSGEKYWTYRAKGEIVAEPSLLANRLFAATRDGDVYALNAKSGKPLWQRRIQGDGFIAPLTATADLILAPSHSGTLYAFSPEDGSQLWAVPGNVKYNSQAIVNGSHIYIGGWAHDFLCFNLQGSLSWRFHASQIIVERAIVNKNVVYFSAYDHSVYALDAVSGTRLWEFTASEPGRVFLIQNHLILPDQKALIVLRAADGSPVHRIVPDAKILRCFQQNSSMILSTARGKIYELNPQEQQLKLLFQSPFPLYNFSSTHEIMVGADERFGIHGFQIPGR